jgi:hypothetical protein
VRATALSLAVSRGIDSVRATALSLAVSRGICRLRATALSLAVGPRHLQCACDCVEPGSWAEALTECVRLR